MGSVKNNYCHKGGPPVETRTPTIQESIVVFGTPLIISAALTTGAILSSGGQALAANPNSRAITAVLLFAALVLASFATYRTALGPTRAAPPPGPALPRLRRRLHARRERSN